MSDDVEEKIRKDILELIDKSSQRRFLEPLNIDIRYIKKLSTVDITFSLKMSTAHAFSDFEMKFVNQESIDKLLEMVRKQMVYGFLDIAEKLGVKNSIVKHSELQKLFHNLTRMIMTSGAYVDMKELGKIAADANL